MYMHVPVANLYMCFLLGFVPLAPDCEEELSNCGVP